MNKKIILIVAVLVVLGVGWHYTASFLSERQSCTGRFYYMEYDGRGCIGPWGPRGSWGLN